jgi:hypothetical protein
VARIATQTQNYNSYWRAREREFSDIVASTAQLTARYSALCEDIYNTISQSNDYPLPLATLQSHATCGPEVPPSLNMPSERKINIHVLDSNNKVSVTKMLESRLFCNLTTKSERVVQISFVACMKVPRKFGTTRQKWT